MMNEELNEMIKRQKRIESLKKIEKIAKVSTILHDLNEPAKKASSKIKGLTAGANLNEGLEIIDEFNALVDNAFEEILYVLFN